MTTPSVYETFLSAIRDHASATCGLDERIARLRTELAHVPESAPTARGYLLLEISRAEDDQNAAARNIALRTALIYGLRTGKGECDIDKPPIWPKGSPTAAENAARGNTGGEPPADPPVSTAPPETPATSGGADPGDAPPADGPRLLAPPAGTAPESADGHDAFMAAIADRAPLADLEAIGWSAHLADTLTSTASRVVVKHRLSPDDIESWSDDDTPRAFGSAWTMADPARMVA